MRQLLYFAGIFLVLSVWKSIALGLFFSQEKASGVMGATLRRGETVIESAALLIAINLIVYVVRSLR